MKNYITVSILSLLIISCKNDPKNINVTKKDNHLKENIQHDIIIGLYSGVQPSYVMKDKFGDDLVINGKKLTIPSAEYKYFFDKNNSYVSHSQNKIYTVKTPSLFGCIHFL